MTSKITLGHSLCHCSIGHNSQATLYLILESSPRDIQGDIGRKRYTLARIYHLSRRWRRRNVARCLAWRKLKTCSVVLAQVTTATNEQTHRRTKFIGWWRRNDVIPLMAFRSLTIIRRYQQPRQMIGSLWLPIHVCHFNGGSLVSRYWRHKFFGFKGILSCVGHFL